MALEEDVCKPLDPPKPPEEHLREDPSELQQQLEDLQEDMVTSVLLDQCQADGQEPDVAEVHPGLNGASQQTPCPPGAVQVPQLSSASD